MNTEDCAGSPKKLFSYKPGKRITAHGVVTALMVASLVGAVVKARLRVSHKAAAVQMAVAPAVHATPATVPLPVATFPVRK